MISAFRKILPNNEQRTCDKYRRVDTRRYPNEKGQHKVMQVGWTLEIERDQDENERERSVDGAREGLIDTAIHYARKRIFSAVEEKIFANSVEDNDGVVHRETHDNEERDDEVAVDLDLSVVPKERKESGGNDDVVELNTDVKTHVDGVEHALEKVYSAHRSS